MTRLFIPLLLIGAAIGLFVLYTNPTYQSTKAVAAEASAYNDALDKSKQLKAKRDELISKRNTFGEDEVKKLEEVLPDNVDNIRLVIDINNIAGRHQLSLKGVNLGTLSDSRSTKNALASGSSGDAVGSVDIGFTVTADYDTMLAFMSDLEHSLRLIDIQKMGFTTGDSGVNEFSFTIRTYWLH